MTRFQFFENDDQIIIVNPLSPFYNEPATILDYRNDYYFVRLYDGMVIRVTLQDVSPKLGNKDEENLYKAHLTQMQHLAVDSNDREWFYEISERLNRFIEYTLSCSPSNIKRDKQKSY